MSLPLNTTAIPCTIGAHDPPVFSGCHSQDLSIGASTSMPSCTKTLRPHVARGYRVKLQHQGYTEQCTPENIYRSVPQIRPPFCNFSFSTKRRGGLYAGCDNFSRDYALPSDEHKASRSAMPCARWGAGQAQGVAEREAERCSRR